MRWAEWREILIQRTLRGLLTKGDRKGEAEEEAQGRGWLVVGRPEELQGTSKEGWQVWSSAVTPALGILHGLSREPSGVEGPSPLARAGFPFPWPLLDRLGLLAQGHPGSQACRSLPSPKGERAQLRWEAVLGGSGGGDEFRELRHHSHLLGPLASAVASGMDSEEEARSANWAWATQGTCSSSFGCGQEWAHHVSISVFGS